MAEPKGFLMVPVGFNPSGGLRALELDANDYLKVALAAWLEGAVDVKGYTGAAWTPLLVNASGQAIVVGKGTSEEVNAALLAPARGLVGGHGYVGGAWQKNPLSFGYSGIVARTIYSENLAAGDNVISDTAVPAGELWVITQMSMVVASATITNLQARFYADGVSSVIVMNQRTPVSNQWYDRQGYWVMAPGASIDLFIGGATLNDDAYLKAAGFRVDIDQ